MKSRAEMWFEIYIQCISSGVLNPPGTMADDFLRTFDKKFPKYEKLYKHMIVSNSSMSTKVRNEIFNGN